MGWTYFHRDSDQGVTEVLKNELGGGPDGSIEYLATAIKGRVFYAACRHKAAIPGVATTADVWGLVVLFNYAPSDHFNFGYKEMDETCGPCESECPDRVLNLLTPTDSEWANNWRARCREYNERQKVIKAKAKPADRDVLKFAKPIRFTNGDTEDTFEIHYERRKVTFRSHPDGYGHYRISKWREREFEILPKAA